MKKILYLLVVFPFVITACGGNEDVEYNETQEDHKIVLDYDEFSAEVEKLEADILASQTPDEGLLKEAVTKFQDFAGAFPDDPKSPDYLLKASDFAMTLNQPEKSVKLLDRIINEYPDYSRMEDVMYVKASHIDLNLRDTTRAKEAYREFMNAYPNSEMIDDCESRIINIRYSIDELAEMFMKKLEEEAN